MPERQAQAPFWVCLVLLLIYMFPIISPPLGFVLSSRFADSHILFYAFVPFLGERHGLIANLTRLLAPLVAAFGAVALHGRRNRLRSAALVVILLAGITLTLVDIAFLTEERNLASLNAHEIQSPELTTTAVQLALERYQEVLLALLAAVLGLTLAAKPGGG